MKTITLKGIPDGLHRELKKRAEANRRSLNSEVLFRLEESLRRITLPYMSDEEMRVARREGRE